MRDATALKLLRGLPKTYLSLHIATVYATEYADTLGCSQQQWVNDRRQMQYEHADGWTHGRRQQPLDLMNWQIVPRWAQLAYLRGYGSGFRAALKAQR